MTFFSGDHCILSTKSALPGTISRNGFFLEKPAFSREKVHYQATISSDDLFFREISKNPWRKLVLITITLQLIVTISHQSFFLPVKYCMSLSLITHNIPIFMTTFWHANCMARLSEVTVRHWSKQCPMNCYMSLTMQSKQETL